MISVLRNAWPLMLGMLLIMVGNGLQGTLLGVRGAIETIDPAWMGYVMAAYFAGFLGGSQITPILLRRVGHVRVFAALGSLVSAAFILYAAFVNPWFWTLMRLLVGFCFAGLYVVAESWLNDTSSNENRGQALSLYIIMQMAGIIIGQLLLNIADPAGYGLFILISVLVSLSFAPILLSVSPAPVYQTATPMTLKELFAASPLGCVGTFLLGGVFSAQFGMSSVFATARNLSVAEISYFITAIYVGGLVLQYPIGWLSDRMDRRLLIIAVTAFATATCSLAMWFSEDYWTLLLIGFFLGGTANPLYILLIAYTNDHLKNEQMASASGGLIFINGVGAMGGPVLVGYLMKTIGSNGYFAFMGVLMAMICLYSLYRMTQRPSDVLLEQTPYTIMPNNTTPITAEIAAEIALEQHEQQTTNEPEKLTKP